MHDLKNAWLKEAQCIETYQESGFDREMMYEKWLLSLKEENCIIDVRYAQRFLKAISITSQHLMYIDHLLQMMPLSYDQFRWTLLHDLDTDATVQKIKEQTGKFPNQYFDAHETPKDVLGVRERFFAGRWTHRRKISAPRAQSRQVVRRRADQPVYEDLDYGYVSQPCHTRDKLNSAVSKAERWRAFLL